MDEKCPKCGLTLIFSETLPTSPHYGRLDCPRCGWIKWVKNPNKVGRSESTKQKINLTCCRLCGRVEEELGARETIEPHHLIPLVDGGSDTPDNLLAVCTSCHKLIHWLWLYIGKHQREKNGRNPEAVEE